MALLSLFRAGRKEPVRRRPARPRAPRGCRPWLETLERRDVLSTFPVTNTNDSGAGSLRQAILDANAHPNSMNPGNAPDTIAFNIGNGGAQSIAPLTMLPAVLEAVVLDATTQPGYAGHPLIEISGANLASTFASGIFVLADGCTVKGFVVNGFTDAGIDIQASNTTTIQSNYLGTDVSGTRALANHYGVLLDASANNLVGGNEFRLGNLLSGNVIGLGILHASATGNVAENNTIGVGATGGALGNTSDGVLITSQATGNAIGRLEQLGSGSNTIPVFEGNTIADNGVYGVDISAGGSGNFVEANDVHGNTQAGVHLGSGATGNQIGVPRPAFPPFIGGEGGNTISGNGGDGVRIEGAGTTGNLVQGNLIGTDSAGARANPNANDGVHLLNGASGNLLGGASFVDTQLGLRGAGNLISGNSDGGVEIDQATANAVQGNFIGTNLRGNGAVPNGPSGTLLDGVDLLDGASNNLIGGTSQVDGNGNLSGLGNLISGNGFDGVFLAAPTTPDNPATQNRVEGNFIGTDVTGTLPLGNHGNGVHLERGAVANVIGGSDPGTGNLISANGNPNVPHGFPNFGAGVQIAGFFANGALTQNLVEGNTIGTDVNGRYALGNLLAGVMLQQGATGNQVGALGAGNRIAGNSNTGILITGATTTGNGVLANTIGLDAAGQPLAVPNSSGIVVQQAANHNQIGQTGAGNVVSGATLYGVILTDAGTSDNVVQGNFIGTNGAGQVALPNNQGGVLIEKGAANNRLGGAGQGNVISGNGVLNPNGGDPSTIGGVVLTDRGTTGNILEDNLIGTDASGHFALGNLNVGVIIRNGASANQVRRATQGNVISGNTTPFGQVGGNGVVITDSGTTGNLVAGNLIGTDIGGTQALGNGQFDPAASQPAAVPTPTGVGIAVLNNAASNQIGTPGGAPNVIAGNPSYQVLLEGTANNTLVNNYVGTNAGGTAALIAGGGAGIVVAGAASGNQIGLPGQPNLIAGNSTGVLLRDNGVTTNKVQGNRIGTDLSGTKALGNADGVVIEFGAHGNTIGGQGAGNVLSGNRSSGVTLTFGASGNQVSANFIGTDAAGMQPLGNDGDGVVLTQGASQNQIGVAGAGNVLAANAGNGVALVGSGTTGNRVQGNWIGTDAADQIDLGNGGDGVRIDNANGNLVGDASDPAASNYIAFNHSDGVHLTGAQAVFNVIYRNYIGTDVSLSARLGNRQAGVHVEQGASDNSIYVNRIAFNGRQGVVIGAGLSDPAMTNPILNDFIFGNALSGIDLGGDGATLNTPGAHASGPNHLQNHPVLSDAGSVGNFTSVHVFLDGAPNANYYVQVFANTALDTDGSAQGEQPLFVNGNPSFLVTTNAQGFAFQTLTFPVNLLDKYLTATATLTNQAGDQVFDTSEFSAPVPVGPLLVAGVQDQISSVFTVVNTNDSGPGSLRQTILDADNVAGLDLINFNIPGPAPHVIQLTSGPLPQVTDPVVIDATTQPGYAPGNHPVVQVDGGNLHSQDGHISGLDLAAGGSIVRGLSITRFEHAAILLDGNGTNHVEGSWLGVDATGQAAGNQTGVEIVHSTANVVGGTTAAARNVIAGNTTAGVLLRYGDTTGNTIAGNWIGVGPDGFTPLSQRAGVEVAAGAANNVIGGPGGAGNTVSGNVFGILIHDVHTTGNTIAGNRIGTDSTGEQAVANFLVGVGIAGGASGNYVGDGIGNVIAGNRGPGVALSGNGTSGNDIGSNTIGLTSDGTALPNLDGVRITDGASANVVGGAAGRNILSGNSGYGVNLTGEGTANNQVLGNYIGTDVTGVAARPNDAGGVILQAGAANNQIGAAGAGNVISGNGVLNPNGGSFLALAGVVLQDPGTTGNILADNLIGTDATGRVALGNQNAGVIIRNGASNNQVRGEAQGNVISGNVTLFGQVGGNGILITDQGTSNNVVTGNRIGTDITGTQALGNGQVDPGRASPFAEPGAVGAGIAVVNNAGGNQIGTPGGAPNVIAGNPSYQVLLEGTSGNVLVNNYVGTNADGSAALVPSSSAGFGIVLALAATANQIGLAGEPNLISGNGGAGVFLRDAGVTQNRVQGNRIGTDVSGTRAVGNSDGVVLEFVAPNNLIGGKGEGNLISGNRFSGVLLNVAVSDTQVSGNLIGTDVTGKLPLGNGGDGVALARGAHHNQIGVAGVGNVIAANAGNGLNLVRLGTGDNTVQGNFIGTTADGTAALGNARYGVVMGDPNNVNNFREGVVGNTIGGIDPGQGNVISGNGLGGIFAIQNGLPAGVISDYAAEGNADDSVETVFNGGPTRGNTGTATDITYAPGKYGQAFQFDGTDSSVSIPDSPSLKPAAVTVSAFAQFTALNAPVTPSASGLQYLVFKQNSRVGNFEGYALYKLRFNGGDHFVFQVTSQDGRSAFAFSPANIQQGVWYHVAGSYDGQTAKIYVNGALAGSAPGGFPLDYGPNPVFFGTSGQSFFDGKFYGLLDEVSLYNRALSDNEIFFLATANGIGENLIYGNAIGTDAADKLDLGNGGDGVRIADSNFNSVGEGSDPSSSNYIAFNRGDGVHLTGAQATYNTVYRDYIGTDITESAPLGNRLAGVHVEQGASNSTINTNRIAFNGRQGVLIGTDTNDNAVGNVLLFNRIFGNGLVGIDVGNFTTSAVSFGVHASGPNHLQNPPGLSGAGSDGEFTSVHVAFFGIPSTSYAIEVFANTALDRDGSAEGEQPLFNNGNATSVITTGAQGTAIATLLFPVNLRGKYLTATATRLDSNGNAIETSEFSLPVQVGPLVPTLSKVTPDVATEAVHTLTVTGQDFAAGATVYLNGQALATTANADGSLTATVLPATTEEGVPQVVTVVNPGPDGGSSNPVTFSVAEAPLTAGLPYRLSATEGVPLTAVVADFRDQGGPEPTAGYRAQISWGDGSQSDATSLVAEVFADGLTHYVVIGTHTYLTAGNYPVAVLMVDEGGAFTGVTSQASVADAPLSAVGKTLSFTEGTSAQPVVAFFSDADPRGAPGQYAATIDWGDGTPKTAGVVSADGSGFDVTGSHTYATHGSYPVTVTITDSGGATTTVQSTAAVDYTALQGTPQGISVAGNKNFSGVVATFTDPDPRTNPTRYQAAITWPDDGSTTAGVITGNNPFKVKGTHTFRSFPGTLTVKVVITDLDSPGRMLTILSRVADPPAAVMQQQYVTQLYLDLLQRPPDDSGLAHWTGLLEQGASRQQVAAGITGSTEYLQLEVRQLYHTLLHRDADASGLGNFTAYLQGGGTVEQAAALIAGSPEYYQARGGGTADGFLQALYEDALGRDVDPSGQAVFGGALARGATRGDVAAAVLGSPEYQADLVEGAYQRFLHRGSDDGGRSRFQAALGRGMRDEALAAVFTASDEYFANLGLPPGS
jgi:Concanavalin A-like lectin/glucanases superfamily/Domain of unknown function (DUF4214)/Right handed beta helix region